MRAYNALKRAGIVKVGQLLSALDGGEAELLKLRNFGQKSLTEVREKLVERGFDVPESTLPLDAAFDEEDDEDDSDEEVKA
jgi:DNA-directed RNA polymerase subunit alpha